MKNIPDKQYTLKTEKNRLVFRTTSFKAEKTSVLHSGVYTKEFSSMMLASAASIFSYMATDIMSSRSPVRYGLLLIVFVLVFLGANRYVFNEKSLEVVFDKSDNTARIVRTGLLKRKTEQIPFSDLKSIHAGSRKYSPENIDGIQFVQHISAQHGSPMPELGEDEKFVTLNLALADGSERIIYAAKVNTGKINGEPDIPLKEIKSFLDTA
jgi:hypothetical protein